MKKLLDLVDEQNASFDEYVKLVESNIHTENIRYITEIHHIVPKSMGGGDDEGNTINLSIDDHILAHCLLYKLLYKSTKNSFRMANAFGAMVDMDSGRLFHARANKEIPKHIIDMAIEARYFKSLPWGTLNPYNIRHLKTLNMFTFHKKIMEISKEINEMGGRTSMAEKRSLFYERLAENGIPSSQLTSYKYIHPNNTNSNVIEKYSVYNKHILREFDKYEQYLRMQFILHILKRHNTSITSRKYDTNKLHELDAFVCGNFRNDSCVVRTAMEGKVRSPYARTLQYVINLLRRIVEYEDSDYLFDLIVGECVGGLKVKQARALGYKIDDKYTSTIASRWHKTGKYGKHNKHKELFKVVYQFIKQGDL